jgi:NADP-dependent 3-hydroxy acid dehydrogenase YdfG
MHHLARWGGTAALLTGDSSGTGRACAVELARARLHLSANRRKAGRWREMLEINVLALYSCTRKAIEDTRRRDDAGYVFHLGSRAGHRVPGGSGVYSATKLAVRPLIEGLRQELRAAGSHW